MDQNQQNDALLEQDPNIILLSDENGNEIPFEFLDLIELEKEEFIVLLPAGDDDSDDSDEVVILQITDDPDDPEQEQYVAVESEEKLQKIFDIFKDRFKDQFEFED